MGLALEIDILASPFRTERHKIIAALGASDSLRRYTGKAVLLFNVMGAATEILGSARLLGVAVNNVYPAEEIITIDEIRWLATPRRYPVRRPKPWEPWATVRSADFELLLEQCNLHHAWGSAAPDVPWEQDDLNGPLLAEIMRRAGGQCQLTGFEGDAKEAVVPRIIRPLSEGGTREPGNFLVLRQTWHGPFSSFHVSVGVGRVLVAAPGRLGADLITRLNANGYLAVPDEAHRTTLEANLSWHFEQYVRQLRWPIAPKL